MTEDDGAFVGFIFCMVVLLPLGMLLHAFANRSSWSMSDDYMDELRKQNWVVRHLKCWLWRIELR